MCRWTATVGVVCAMVGTVLPAMAQFGTFKTGSATSGSPVGTMPMPGQQVGSVVNLNPAGQMLPKAAPQAGAKIGSPLQGAYDPSNPLASLKGSGLSASDVIAPVAGYPGGVGGQQPNLLTQLYTKLGSIVGMQSTETTGETPNVTPGIFRRRQARVATQMYRYD